MLSIVIPTLNEAGNIMRLLEEIRPQLLEGDEVIVVDGKSVDGTGAMVRDAGFEVVVQEPRGIGGAKTEGARHARNEILVFLDADGSIPKDYLQRIRGHFGGGEADVVGGIMRYSSRSPQERFLYTLYAGLLFQVPKWIHRLTGKYGLPSNNIAIRRDLFMEAGGYRSVVVEDFDLMLRMPPSRRVRYDSRMEVVLSSRRFEKQGFFRTVAYWIACAGSDLVGRGQDGAGYRI